VERYYNLLHIIDTARIVCRAGSMKLSNVRPSVCLSHSVAAYRCGGFAAVGPAWAGDTDRLLHGQRPAVSSKRRQCHIVS